jgi:hypothetical protein
LMRAIPMLVVGSMMVGCAERKGAWRELFNGRDLSGWRTNVTNSWVVKDGAITWKDAAVDLWTVEQFGDFDLELEFKCSAGCNSGVFIRTADPANNVQTGLEVQIWDSVGVKKLEKHHCAAIYDAIAPSVNAEMPVGEWNRLRIVARGSVVQVHLNGQLVTDADLDRWVEAGKNPDGTANKFKQALKDFPRRGHIGLQDHHKMVQFRGIRIREI